ncbi:MAG: ABC transporter substrate-binding protein [Candidatus Eiseniibacteriota bacterium]
MHRKLARRIALSSGLVTVLAALALGLPLLSGCGQQTGGTIKVGVYGSLTGTTATFGESTKNGVELAANELNAAGGVGGKTIALVVEDDQSKAEEAATAVQKLIAQDRVVALLGEVASSRSLAAAPIAQQNGVPMISPSSTNPEVTKKGNYIFRACFIDPFQGTVMAKFASQNLHLKRVAILKDVKNDYSVGLAQFFTEEFQGRLGGTITGEQAYNEGDSDFRSQLTALKANNPEAIFVPGYYTEVGLVARQARELGIQVPLLGGDGWVSDKLLEIGGEALNGSYYSNHFANDQPSEALQKFITDYKAKYGSAPDAIAGLAYDAARLLFDSMARLQAADPQAFAALDASKEADAEAQKAARAKLRDEINNVKDFQGVTGVINFDADRNPVKPAVVIAVESGQEKFAASIAP